MRDMNYEPADIIIYIRDKGIVLQEKSLVAYEEGSGKIIAVGNEAEGLAEAEKHILVRSPLRRGIVADYFAAAAMFANLFQKAMGKKSILKPAVVVCVSEDTTEVEKKALEEVIRQGGASQLLICHGSAEQFIKENVEKEPKSYSKYKVIVGITKKEPEKYIQEAMDEILQYAVGEGISADRVVDICKEKVNKQI